MWCGSSRPGIALAALLPRGPELAYIGLLALFALCVPMLVGRPARAAACASTAALVLAAVILRTRHALWGLGAGSACYLALLWLGR